MMNSVNTLFQSHGHSAILSEREAFNLIEASTLRLYPGTVSCSIKYLGGRFVFNIELDFATWLQHHGNGPAG